MTCTLWCDHQNLFMLSIFWGDGTEGWRVATHAPHNIYLGSGWAELQTDSSLYQNGSLLLNISWGEVYNPPSNTLTSAQNTSLDWKTILADKLMVNDSEFGGINYDLSVVLWCPPPPSPSTTGENFPLIPEQHEAGPGQGPGQAWEHHFKLKTASPS